MILAIILTLIIIIWIAYVIKTQLAMNFTLRILEESLEDYQSLPPLYKMIFSFKPLTRENWLPRK